MTTEHPAATTAAYWDGEADAFDHEPDHGLRDPGVRAAWERRLGGWLEGPARDVADLGCGTGSLALLAAGHGHRVTGVDLSPRMAALARAKLAGTGSAVVVGDAAAPPLRDGCCDVLMARHVLWTLPDPGAVLRRWAACLRPGGRLVLVEGRWGVPAGAGLTAAALARLVRPLAARLDVRDLADDPALWGRVVADERYAIIADLA